MDFVAACANIRAHCFGIRMNTRFTIKSMAGNIIPAIATTNAIIAAMVVLEAFKLLEDRPADCKTVYLNRQPNARKRLLVPCVLEKPNPKCYVCAEKPEVSVRLDVNTLTLRAFEDHILKSALNMVAPDAELLDGRGTILISSEEGETEALADKTLAQMSVRDGMQLRCDDFLQNYELVVNVVQSTELENGVEFELVGDASQLKPTTAAAASEAENNGASTSTANGNGNDAGGASVDSDDDLVCLSDMEEEDDQQPAPPAQQRSKRPASGDDAKRPASADQATPPAKKRRAVGEQAPPEAVPVEPEVIEL